MHFLGDTAILVLGEEALILVPRAGEPRTVPAHGGVILCSSADADRIVTGEATSWASTTCRSKGSVGGAPFTGSADGCAISGAP